MEIDTAKSFFAGRVLQYNPQNRSFNVETAIQHIYNMLPFVVPSTVSLNKLASATPLSSEFLKELRDDFNKLDNIELFKSSEDFLHQLEEVKTKDATDTINHIRAQQAAFKIFFQAELCKNPRDTTYVDKAPQFFLNDPECLSFILEKSPEQLAHLPKEILKSNKTLAESTIREISDPSILKTVISKFTPLISCIPQETLLLHPEICETAIKQSILYDEPFPLLPKEVYIAQKSLRKAAFDTWGISDIPKEALQVDKDLCMQAIEKKFSNIAYIPLEIQIALKDKILAIINQAPPKQEISAYDLSYLHNDIKTSCLPKIASLLIKGREKDPKIIEKYDPNFFIANPTLVQMVINLDPSIITQLDPEVQNSKSVLDLIIPDVTKNLIASAGAASAGATSGDSITLDKLMLKYPVEMRSFLIAKLNICIQSEQSGKIPKYSATADLTPLLASAIFYSWGTDKSKDTRHDSTDYKTKIDAFNKQSDIFNDFLKTFKKDLKDGGRRNQLLKFMKELDSLELEPEKKAEYFNKCFGSAKNKIDLDNCLNSATYIIAIFQTSGKEGLDSIKSFDESSLKEQAIGALIAKGIILEEQKEAFEKTFCDPEKSRKTDAIFAYCRKIDPTPLFKTALNRFINDVLNKTFIENRHKNNSLKELLNPDQKTKWETCVTSKVEFSDEGKPKSFISMDSEDWQDLFLSGTEVLGSCQSVYDDAFSNKYLMGYCLDGKIKILTLKSVDDKTLNPILFRSLLKIMKDPSGKPCLFIEKSYGSSKVTPSIEKALKKLAKEKADSMGIACYESSTARTSDYVLLESNKSNTSGYEYSDMGSFQKSTGRYSVYAKLVEVD